MENVLSGFIVIFLLLFTVLTSFENGMSGLNTVEAARSALEARIDARSRTRLSVLDTQILNDGTLIAGTLRNDGQTTISDYAHWDAIVEYTDSAEIAGYHVDWVPHGSLPPVIGQWAVAGLYVDTEQGIAEAFDPAILNPDEEIVVHTLLASPVAFNTTARVTLATDGGVTVTALARRNLPPTLTTNTGAVVVAGKTVELTTSLLEVTDNDNTPDELLYTITAGPAYGTLTLPTVFTQAEIDGGLLAYSHGSGEPDAFTFTVSDGINTIGPFTFEIEVDDPPVVEANAALLVIEGRTSAISAALLKYGDSDTPAAELVYTLRSLPQGGILSLGPTFTQADIDAGLLSYSAGDAGFDGFLFEVSDGRSTSEPAQFAITIEADAPAG